MKRGGYIKRRTPLRKRNPKRKARLKEDQEGPQYAACRVLPCAVPDCFTRPVVGHHMTSRAAGGGDETCVPLCWVHHSEWHTCGNKRFSEIYGTDLWRTALELSEMIQGG